MARNIVLLSDGTGNSAASPFKTNVWRLYQAIDIEPPSGDNREQIVFYDDGVGTETFKPLAALGGALGLGVWKNVKDLYTFACRNYQPGDQIFGFGFSRGAFTIRLVMGLIGKCGIVQTNPHSETKLLQAVQMAYEAYRRDYLLRAAHRRGFTMFPYRMLPEPRYRIDREGHKRIDLTNGEDNSIVQFFLDIPFLGVWDTVDAYGMPVDELKLAIDHWVWPMSFADRNPPTNISTIRQALSLDDERPTFRPVLWNEVMRGERGPGAAAKQRTFNPQRILQVWFAGVHANVGGGYPDDGLAFTTLKWMMDEAEAAGLRYDKMARDEIKARVNPHGKQYNSRSGIAGYYRYGPRSVSALCNDKQHGVEVTTPYVHVHAFDRVARQQRAYAPVSLNERFELIGGIPAQYPPPAYLEPEMDILELAWDIVWWRRLAYFATVTVTIFVGLFFAALIYRWPNDILRYVENAIAALIGSNAETAAQSLFKKLGGGLADVLPGWVAAVLPKASEYPFTAVLSLALLAILFFKTSVVLQRCIDAYAEWAWGDQKGLPPGGAPKPTWLNAIARPGRKVSNLVHRILWLGAVVNFTGICLGILALLFSGPYCAWLARRRRPWMA